MPNSKFVGPTALAESPSYIPLQSENVNLLLDLIGDHSLPSFKLPFSSHYNPGPPGPSKTVMVVLSGILTSYSS